MEEPARHGRVSPPGVEQARHHGPQAEAVAGAGGQDDTLEGRQHLGVGRDVDAVAEVHALIPAAALQRLDVGGEGGLAGRHPLEVRGLARVAEGAARHRLGVDHGDPVAVGGQIGVGQARRAGADDADLLAPRRRRAFEFGLAPGHRVDQAACRGAAAHAVDARVAGQATAHRRPPRRLVHPLGVGEQTAPEGDEVGLAAVDGVGGRLWIAEPADRDDRHVDDLPDARRVIQEGRLRVFHGRNHGRRRGQRAIVPARDVHGVGPGLGRPAGHLDGLREDHAGGEEIVGVHAEYDGESRHLVLDAAQNVEAEAGTVLDRAAVFVGAPVFLGAQELGDQIAVGAMQLDAVEPGLADARRRRHEGLGRPFDALPGHLDGHHRLGGHLENGMGNGRGRDGRLAADVLAGVAAGVAELDGEARAVTVQLAGQTRQAGQEAVVVDAQLVGAVTPHLLGRRHLHGDQPDAAHGARLVIGDGGVGHVAVAIGQLGRHGRHDDAVADFHAPDQPPGKKGRHAASERAPSGFTPACSRARRMRPISASPSLTRGGLTAALGMRPRMTRASFMRLCMSTKGSA